MMKPFVPPSSLMTSESWLLVPCNHEHIKNHVGLKGRTISIDHQLDRRSSIDSLDRRVNAAILILVR
jgi:hypothetical protein